MGSIGGMVADLSLNYANFMRGLSNCQGGMGSFQTNTAAWMNVTANLAARTLGGISNFGALATTTTSSAVGNVLRGTGAMVGGFGRFGQSAVSAFGSWRMHSAQMRTELLRQNLLLTQQRQLRDSMARGGAGATMGQIGGGVLLGSLFGRTAQAAKAVPTIGLQLASDAEQAKIAFEVMLGSADKAVAMLSQLKAYADKSPFNVAGVNAAAQRLLNYNIQAQDVLPTMKMLGDVAAGDMDKFDRLATAFGQMSANGRLMGQDLLQFINAGFNPLQEISKKTGESMAALKKRMEDGGIASLEVRDAFVAATSAGGRFFNMTARQSATHAGMWSTFKDAVGTALRGAGEALMNNFDLKGWIDWMTKQVNRVPYLFANAGQLLQVELLDWQVYLMELVPGSETVIMKIGAVLSAGWDALGASYHRFIDSVKAGFQEIINLAEVAKNAAGSGAKGWWETTKTYLSFGMLGEEGAANPLHMFNRAGATAVTTLAGQKDAMQPGEDFASTFLRSFNEALKKAEQGGAGTSLVETLKRQRDELRNAIKPEGAGGVPAADFGGKLGASFNSAVKEKDEADKESKKNATSEAALKGSQEANRIMNSQFGGGVQSQQLKVLQDVAATLKTGFQNLLKPENVATGLRVGNNLLNSQAGGFSVSGLIAAAGNEISGAFKPGAGAAPTAQTVGQLRAARRSRMRADAANRLSEMGSQAASWVGALIGEGGGKGGPGNSKQMTILERIANASEETARKQPKKTDV